MVRGCVGRVPALRQRLASTNQTVAIGLTFCSSECLKPLQFDSPLQMQLPVFALAGVASWATAWCFSRFRKEQPSLAPAAAWDLTVGCYIAACPFSNPIR
jgi:hypothetical protein